MYYRKLNGTKHSLKRAKRKYLHFHIFSLTWLLEFWDSICSIVCPNIISSRFPIRRISVHLKFVNSSTVVWTCLFNHDAVFMTTINFIGRKLTNLHSTCCDPKNFSYCIDGSVLLRTRTLRIHMTRLCIQGRSGVFFSVLIARSYVTIPAFSNLAESEF